MGIPPTKFRYNGRTYTPKGFMRYVTRLNPDNYVDFMSLMQKPYWSQEEYKVPDNWWRSEEYYNIPLDDFMSTIKNSIKNGYSISIGGDVSETGYSSNLDVAHLIGYKIDENEDWWFLIKDSGSGSRNGNFPGYYFYHEDYVKLKMMTFTIHKDAVKEILKKFNK